MGHKIKCWAFFHHQSLGVTYVDSLGWASNPRLDISESLTLLYQRGRLKISILLFCLLLLCTDVLTLFLCRPVFSSNVEITVTRAQPVFAVLVTTVPWSLLLLEPALPTAYVVHFSPSLFVL